MGFYECVHDCDDDNYCVSISSSLDSFESISWIYCEKHKLSPNYYDIFNFLRRYSQNPTHLFTRINIIETKQNHNKRDISKIELMDVTKKMFDNFKLNEMKKIYFSEFDDCPSWEVVDNKIIIIDYIHNYESRKIIKSPINENPNVIFNWATYRVEKINIVDPNY